MSTYCFRVVLCVSHLNAIGRRFLNFQKKLSCIIYKHMRKATRYSYVPSLLHSLEGDAGR